MDSSHTMSRSETSPNTTSPKSSKSFVSSHTIQNNLQCTFLIVGGGIAGVSCAETINFLASNEPIIILTESSLIKSVTNLVQLGKFIQKFDVKEIEFQELGNSQVQVVFDQLKVIESKNKIVHTVNGKLINYKFLCICTGARPKLINSDVAELILGIRDTESVKQFQKRIKSGEKFVLVGNGGIASEIAYEISNIEIDWVIKDQHISSTFIDAGASKFFESKLHNKDSTKYEHTVVKRLRYMEEKAEISQQKGAALGPDWHRLINMSANSKDNINIHYGSEIRSVTRNKDGDHPLNVELTDGKRIESDFIVSATGVHPHLDFECDDELKLGPGGGIIVDELMRSSIDSIYAAGDVCDANWDH